MHTIQEDTVLQLDEVDNAKWFTKDELEDCDTWDIVKKIAYQVLN
ncbi:MAG: hypothetical protein WCJ19_04815 [bacterium]